jgi:hypothetical protein
MRYFIAACVLLLGVSPASADLIRIDFVGSTEPGHHRPAGSPVAGFIVYDSNALPTGLLFNGTISPPRFDGAVIEFELAGIKGSNANFIYLIDAPDPTSEDSFHVVDQSGISLVLSGPGVLNGSALPALPHNWTHGSWEINPPEPFSQGQLSSISSMRVGDSPAAARRVLHAANEGTDTPVCGEPNAKCRSISQAIKNARDGDTVMVEVGVYGDLNGNGVIGEPGEESGGPCHCLVNIDKEITVLSERGAAATIIDARNVQDVASAYRSIVSMVGDNRAAFGFAEQGFTLLAAPAQVGVYVDSGAIHARVWGNRVTGGSIGIDAHRGDVYGNELTANQTGIVAADARISGNIVTSSSGNGIEVNGSTIGQRVLIEGNVVNGNGGAGLRLDRAPHATIVVTGNDIVHNGGPGIAWTDFLSLGAVVVQDNNIFGNGHADALVKGCGIKNDTGGFVWATDNYWGALGVADRACDGPGSTTMVEPVRSEPDSRIPP